MDTHLGRNISLLIDVFINSQRLQAQSDLIKLWADTAKQDFKKAHPSENILHALAEISGSEDIISKYERHVRVPMVYDFLFIIWELSKNTGDYEQFSTTTMDAQELSKFAENQVSVFNQTGAMNPDFSTWHEQPWLTDDYALMARQMPKHSTQAAMFNALPGAERERLLLEDALYTFMGVEGEYVYLKEGVDGAHTFELLEGINPVPHADRVLKLGSYFVQVSKYIDTHQAFECGRVNHALCAAMNSLIKDYLIFVTQLEQKCRQGNFTLQQLLLFIQPSLHIMTTLREITREAAALKVRGGALINTIHLRALRTAGDAKTQGLFMFLLQAACEPYMEMLKAWMYKGLVKDPYNEFLIEDKRHVVREASSANTIYDDKYLIREHNVPVFLQRVKHKILTTGKYLNVIRECGIEIHNADWVKEFKYTENEHVYIEQVSDALRHASELVLTILRKNYDLLGRLQSMKRYFLLDQADFMGYFMDQAMTELTKPGSQVTEDTLDSLLELSFRMSSAKDDPFWENLRCGLSAYSLISMLIIAADGQANPDGSLQNPAFEYFTLDYEPGWPLQLIFDERALSKYQALFRTLFYFKHVERVLASSWFSQQMIKKFFLGTPGTYGASSIATNQVQDDPIADGPMFLHQMSALRSRMLHFVRTFQYYMIVDVIEPNFAKMMNAVKTASTMEGLVQSHENFLDSTLAQCLLRCEGPFVDATKLLMKVMARMVMFANYVEGVMAPLDVAAISKSATAATPSAKKAGGARIAQVRQEEETARKARGSPSDSIAVVAKKTIETHTNFGFSAKVALTSVNTIIAGKKDRLASIALVFDDETRHLMNIVGNQTFSLDRFDLSRLNSLISRLDANEYFFKTRPM